jgi:3-methyl-2-oxobutanoate hydroxymethyltransferase
MKFKRLLPADIKKKTDNRPAFSAITAYDVMSAQIADEAQIDILLVGDSCGNVVAGYSTTLPVTMDHIIYHSQAVVRGSQRALVVADMPFMSYQESNVQAKRNAGLLLKEGGVAAVKMEILPSQLDTLRSVVDIGIPVMGHIGFTPQTMFQLGGYKVQGKTDDAALALLELAEKVAQAGAFSVVLEMIPPAVSQRIQSQISIPTIGVGAGPHCDGQMLVFHDVVGLTQSTAKFVKRYAEVRSDMSRALAQYRAEVAAGDFPSAEHGY